MRVAEAERMAEADLDDERYEPKESKAFSRTDLGREFCPTHLMVHLWFYTCHRRAMWQHVEEHRILQRHEDRKRHHAATM